ncbi:hypothetical protein FHW69_000524 [Luteibacter sp. Sphag1AF]|uniref:phosphodiester glycosidase family protein n=1 Tax=Luteibacter sp. Sphag1AF TaxID=2587031 RepID=UPI00179AB489|nr:phosphodiester glycosidase family protein [Luteibacter sp. Sphag1AF]MBB3225934.1 hypothetical protein [Luteibacter sp. Sphag1AF]
MTPLSGIQQNMQRGATYHRLTVDRGAQRGNVFGTREGEAPRSPQELALSAPRHSAVINGGYFVHKGGLQTDTGETIHGLGRPVGPTHTRSDHTPVPSPWQGDYGRLTVGHNTGLSSGPLLMHGGRLPDIPDHDRFKYRLGSAGENPLNSRAGALTHASDHNERAAVSIDLDSRTLRMHTLTAGGQRHLGGTMRQWQQIVAHGSGPRRQVDGFTHVARASALNLDGGGSVFMGVRTSTGIRQISRGGNPTEAIRPVANVIASKSPR